MRWIVAPRMQAEIVGFTGINFSVSGRSPSGPREAFKVSSTGADEGIGIIAPVGTRLILRTSSERVDAVSLAGS